MSIPPLSLIFHHIDDNEELHKKRLLEAVNFKSISTDPVQRDNIINIVNWITEIMQQCEITTEIRKCMQNEETIPIILGSVGNCPKKLNVLLYGYLDIDSFKETDLTNSNDELSGPGVLKNKGPILAWMNTIEAFKKTETDLPVNVRFLLEFMKNALSPGLKEVLEQEKNKFLDGVDLVCFSDGYWLSEDVPTIIYGFQGVCEFSLIVKCANKNPNSKIYNVAIKEAMADLVYLLNNLVDKKGNITIPNIMESAQSEENKASRQQINFDEQKIPSNLKVNASTGNTNSKLIIKEWTHPSLRIHEVSSNDSNTIGIAKARFSIRIAPGQTPLQVSKCVSEYIDAIWADKNSSNEMELSMINSTNAINEDYNSPAYVAASKAAYIIYGKKMELLPCGTSFQALNLLKEKLNVAMIMLPICSEEVTSEVETISVRDYKLAMKYFTTFLNQLGEYTDLNVEIEQSFQSCLSIVDPDCICSDHASLEKGTLSIEDSEIETKIEEIEHTIMETKEKVIEVKNELELDLIGESFDDETGDKKRSNQNESTLEMFSETVTEEQAETETEKQIKAELESIIESIADETKDNTGENQVKEELELIDEPIADKTQDKPSEDQIKPTSETFSNPIAEENTEIEEKSQVKEELVNDESIADETQDKPREEQNKSTSETFSNPITEEYAEIQEKSQVKEELELIDESIADDTQDKPREDQIESTLEAFSDQIAEENIEIEEKSQVKAELELIDEYDENVRKDRTGENQIESTLETFSNPIAVENTEIEEKSQVKAELELIDEYDDDTTKDKMGEYQAESPLETSSYPISEIETDSQIKSELKTNNEIVVNEDLEDEIKSETGSQMKLDLEMIEDEDTEMRDELLKELIKAALGDNVKENEEPPGEPKKQKIKSPDACQCDPNQISKTELMTRKKHHVSLVSLTSLRNIEFFGSCSCSDFELKKPEEIINQEFARLNCCLLHLPSMNCACSEDACGTITCNKQDHASCYCSKGDLYDKKNEEEDEESEGSAKIFCRCEVKESEETLIEIQDLIEKFNCMDEFDDEDQEECYCYPSTAKPTEERFLQEINLEEVPKVVEKIDPSLKGSKALSSSKKSTKKSLTMEDSAKLESKIEESIVSAEIKNNSTEEEEVQKVVAEIDPSLKESKVVSSLKESTKRSFETDGSAKLESTIEEPIVLVETKKKSTEEDKAQKFVAEIDPSLKESPAKVVPSSKESAGSETAKKSFATEGSAKPESKIEEPLATAETTQKSTELNTKNEKQSMVSNAISITEGDSKLNPEEIVEQESKTPESEKVLKDEVD